MQAATHIFIFGSFPTISLAELVAVAGEDCIISARQRSALVAMDDHERVIACFRRLGGATRVAAIRFRRVYRHHLPDKIREVLQEMSNERVLFGLSAVETQSLSRKEIERMGIALKRWLCAQGKSSRFVTSRDPLLSSVVVTKNNLLTNGAEILLIEEEKHQFMIATTLAVQEFEQWGRRDVGRPRRNARRGMLPPKLARMMVNLANPLPLGEGWGEGILLDPFCGSGTILMEALELGYSVIGSDVSAVAIEDTKQNLEWFRTNAKLPMTNYQLLTSDVRDLAQKLPPHSIAAIVTEPDLGPPQAKLLRSEKEIENVRKKLANLYLQSFAIFVKILKPGGRVAISLPVWRVGLPRPAVSGESGVRGANEKLVYSISDSDLNIIKGFKIIPPLSKQPQATSHKLTPRQTLLYGRPDQFVWREIVVLQK